MALLRELLFSALVLASTADAMYGKHSSVVEVDYKNFDREILQSKNAAIVEFYAPWCGHCKNLKPTYEKVAKAMKGIGKVAAIDCDDERNKRTCGEYGIQGFPTLKIFRPSAKKGKPMVEDYQGPRTAKAIADALGDRIPNHVTRIKDKALADFYKKDNSSTKAILFTEKGTTPPLWKSLAVDFHGAISFHQVRNGEQGVIDAFGIDSLPKVVLLPGGEDAPMVYDGPLKKEDLFNFFAAVKTPIGEPNNSSKTQQAKSKAKDAKNAAKSKAEETTEKFKEASEEASSASSTAARKATENAPVIPPTLTQGIEIQSICLEKKAKTCILALIGPDDTTAIDVITGVYDQLMKRPPPHTFNIYRVDVSGPLADVLNKHLEFGGKYPQVLAVNWRGWYKKYPGDASNKSDILAWLDAVKMGEGKKEKIPEAFIMEESEAEAKQQQEKIIEAAKKMVEEMEGNVENPDTTLEEEAKAKEEEKTATHDEL